MAETLSLPHLPELSQVGYIGLLTVAEVITEGKRTDPDNEDLIYHQHLCDNLTEALEADYKPQPIKYKPNQIHEPQIDPFVYLFKRYAPEFRRQYADTFSRGIRRLRIF